jgi:aryl-alcohol dehydrogenase-like predicted oxidoreductase
MINPNVSTVILGASKAAQLRESLDALDVLSKLENSVRQRIEEIVGNKPDALPRY